VFVTVLKPLFGYAWFVGFGVSAGAYLALAKLRSRGSGGLSANARA
jgi:cytosine/uracil/thiamine/allantoin permease